MGFMPSFRKNDAVSRETFRRERFPGRTMIFCRDCVTAYLLKINLFTEYMLADGFDNRTAADPAAGSSDWIIVINGASCRIPAI